MSSPAENKPPRRLWKWLKRIILTGALLCLTLAVFHRAIVLAVLRWAGPRLAITQGLPLDWQVTGSLWNDLSITSVKTGGGDGHWLPEASIGKLSVSYDASMLAHGEFEHAVKNITLHDADLQMDLRHLPAAEASAKPPEDASAAGKAPPLVWPETIDLENINAALTLADGSHVTVRGLTLRIGKGMPGIFACREFRMEPDGPVLEKLKAEVAWEPRKIGIRNFTLPSGAVLEEFHADLAEFDSGMVDAALKLRLGPATMLIDASAAGIFKAPMQVKAIVKADQLRAEELHGLGLPADVIFEKVAMSAVIAGDPLQPAKMSIDATLHAEDIHAAGASVDMVDLELSIDKGRADLKSVKISRTENVVEASAGIVLPEDLKDWLEMKWTASVKATLPEAVTFLDEPPPVTGSVVFSVNAHGTGMTPSKAAGTLQGESLAFESYALPHLSTSFSIDGRQARLEIPQLELGEGNSLALKASLLMEDALPVEAEWSLHVSDAAGVMNIAGIKAPPNPVKGTVESKGTAKFAVNDITAENYTKVIADVSLHARDLFYGDGSLERVTLDAHVENGKATLQPCLIRFDAENAIELAGQLGLQKPFVFESQGKIGMPKLVVLNNLLKTFDAPPIQSGAISSKLDVKGQLQPWQCSGGCELTATQVRMASMPEAASASLATTFEGTRAELAKLEATLGPWKLGAKGCVDETHADLSELHFWQNKTLLVQGHARVPFDVMQSGMTEGRPVDVSITAKELRVHEVLAAAGVKDMPSGVLNAEINLSGRLDSAAGMVRVNLHEVKVPNAPKAFQPASVDFDASLQNKQVMSHIKISQPPLQSLTAEAELPLDAAALVKEPATLQTTPIKAKITLPEIDLGFLTEYAPDLIKSIPAKMKLDASITGTVAAPLISAALDLDASEVVWVSADMPSVRDLRARIRTTDRTATIEDMSVMLAGGRVKLSGTVDAAEMTKPAFDLKLDAREALVFRDPSTSVRANADITCRGDLASARVEGLVEAVRGRVFKEIDLLPALKLPSNAPPVPPDTKRSETKLPLPPIIKDWNFDLKIKTRDPLLISGNLVNSAVSAGILFGGTGANPQLTGKVNIDRMLLKLPFSLVKITRGVITLNPEKPFDPQLDIRGESRIGSSEIALYVYGETSDPKTRFTASPPMSEPDIVTLLATGTTLNGSASDVATEAATRAAFLFISELYRKTFNKKKVIREEPPRLNMTFNPSGADRSNDSVQASYELTDKWRFLARFTQTGRMRGALGYLLRFGKAAQSTEEEARR